MAGTELCLPLRTSAGGPVAVIRLRIGSERLSFGSVDGAGRIRGGARIERTPCRFGGTRPWLLCPRCNSRRSILYGIDKNGGFSCRGCMKLVYCSQDERKMVRLWLKERKLEKKLRGPSGTKPKSMHWTTYNRVSAALSEVRAKETALFIRGARAYLDQNGWPPSGAKVLSRVNSSLPGC
jgi:hypothetical protein